MYIGEILSPEIMAKSEKRKTIKNSVSNNIRIEGDLKAENKIFDSGNDNYKYWRKVQRKQLGVSANIFLLFATAILGFVMHFLIGNKHILQCNILVLLTVASVFLLFSIGFYGWFTHNRLKDFRMTAQYFNQRKDEIEVGELTNDIGKFTWNLYDYQRLFLFQGFIFSVIGFCIYIYS